MMAGHYTRDNLAAVLRAHEINPTHQRIEIAYALFSRAAHLSADQLLAIVNGRHSETSKATVYNTLNLFRQQGLLRTVDVDPTRQFYDSSTSAHHHFYNVDTGELTDIPLESVSLQVDTALPAGTEQAGVDVVVRVRGRRVG
jgi:Fur family transcriptional regulator, iron response regulator